MEREWRAKENNGEQWRAMDSNEERMKNYEEPWRSTENNEEQKQYPAWSGDAAQFLTKMMMMIATIIALMGELIHFLLVCRINLPTFALIYFNYLASFVCSLRAGKLELWSCGVSVLLPIWLLFWTDECNGGHWNKSDCPHIEYKNLNFYCFLWLFSLFIWLSLECIVCTLFFHRVEDGQRWPISRILFQQLPITSVLNYKPVYSACRPCIAGYTSTHQSLQGSFVL